MIWCMVLVVCISRFFCSLPLYRVRMRIPQCYLFECLKTALGLHITWECKLQLCMEVFFLSVALWD